MTRVSAGICSIAMLLMATTSISHAESDQPLPLATTTLQFNTPEIRNYQVNYSSAMGEDVFFTLVAKKSRDGTKLVLIDIIPMDGDVIVAQRHIDIELLRTNFSAGPCFAGVLSIL